MNYKKSFVSLIVGLSLLGAGCSLTHTVNVNSTTSTNLNTNVSVNTSANTNAAATISYSGQIGKNALELLESKHQVDVSSQGFVNAIDGVKPGDHQFWSFYVNGKQAEVGARDYITKADDQIEWRLESY